MNNSRLSPLCCYIVKIRQDPNPESYCMACFHRNVCSQSNQPFTGSLTAKLETGHSFTQGSISPIHCTGCGENLIKFRPLDKCALCTRKYNEFYFDMLLQDIFIDNATFIYDVHKAELLYYYDETVTNQQTSR